MKGIFHLKPPLPKYNCTWDVTIVLDYIRQLPPKLSLLPLSRKLATLLALTTGQRLQTLHLLDTRNIVCTNDYIKLHIGDLLKQSRPGKHLSELFIESYSLDERLCVVKTYQHYLEKTSHLRLDTRLFICTQKPYLSVSKDTLARWIKDVLRLSGIDMTMFSAHSTRSAACSAVSSVVNIDTVLKTAGWTTDNTFRKYYNKRVTNDSSFSRELLNH